LPSGSSSGKKAAREQNTDDHRRGSVELLAVKKRSTVKERDPHRGEISWIRPAPDRELELTLRQRRTFDDRERTVALVALPWDCRRHCRVLNSRQVANTLDDRLDEDVLANDGTVAGESALPEIPAQNHRRSRGGVVVGGREYAAERGLNPERREEFHEHFAPSTFSGSCLPAPDRL
jgi:hypothetical protein